ncbi:MAG: 3-methyladenine DNA glycosylase [Actinomycetota bacterium]|nr:3-methyladenine DNA glycosylase [Actinomycetota bacterium]
MLDPVERAEWSRRRAAHEARVDRLLAGHLSRQCTGERHPVEDFLFTYYSFRPAALRRWHPGPGVLLRGDCDLAERRGYRRQDDGVALDPEYVEHRRDRVRWVRDLLAATARRAPSYGCLGLHEWAMVYRAAPQDVRHPAWPLRLGGAGTDAVVESHRLGCTHHDAFRFFTDAARPRNTEQPTREGQPRQEQPGCLHTGMDLYKWAYKLSPMTPSELVADCFELARDIRVLDMRASPYDLRALGYTPVRIETTAGKREYAERQRRFAELAAPLRQRLVEACESLLAQSG